MTTTTNQRKCLKCEESVHPQAVACPYCRAELLEGKPTEVKTTLNPPYRLVTAVSPDEPIPTPLYSPEPIIPTPPPKKAPLDIPLPPQSPRQQSLSSELKPLILLLTGAVFFLFGLVLFLYSDQGVFTLHWNSSWWPFYLLSSLPLLYFGWRSFEDTRDFL